MKYKIREKVIQMNLLNIRNFITIENNKLKINLHFEMNCNKFISKILMTCYFVIESVCFINLHACTVNYVIITHFTIGNIICLL